VNRHDAIIVGAGPAGSSCARGLARAGLDVVVIDRAQFPRHKPCAGWITPGVFDALEIRPADYGEGRTLQPIAGFRVCVWGRRGCDAAFGTTVSHGIRRSEFDHYLLERSGARTMMGTPVTRAEQSRGRWVVNGDVEAPVLVGAGGHFCPVAARVSPHRLAGPLVLAQELEFEIGDAQAAACRTRPTLPSLFFCPDLQGYGWVVCKGRYLNVGFGHVDRQGFADRARRFREWLVAEGEVPPGTPANWCGHAYRVWGRPQRPLVTDGALLVGDAAGVAAPSSGEGIRPAIESGQLAARAIVDAGGVYTRDRLEAYRLLLERRLGPPPSEPGPGARLGDRIRHAVGARLIGQAWFARRVVSSRFLGRVPRAHAGPPC
jgi:geranylgeranyl reductase family protein